MKRWKVILAASLIYATGVITGGLAWRAANLSHASDRPRNATPPPFVEARFDAIKQLRTELDLTPAQADRIDAILESGHKQMRQVWETSCQPKVREQMKKVHEMIRAELTPAQCAKYDVLLKKAKERHSQQKEKEKEKGEGEQKPWKGTGNGE